MTHNRLLPLSRAAVMSLAIMEATIGDVRVHQPDLRPIKLAGYVYQNARPYSITISGITIDVPQYYCTDGASVPAAARVIIERDGLWRAAALVHDWLYANGGKLPGITLTRDQCDFIFYNIMIASGVDAKTAGIMWRAVHHFGKGPWRAAVAKGPLVLDHPLYYEIS